VICLPGQWVKNVVISNWERISFAPVIWTIEGENTTFHSCGDGGRFLWPLGTSFFKSVELTFGNSKSEGFISPAVAYCCY